MADLCRSCAKAASVRCIAPSTHSCPVLARRPARVSGCTAALPACVPGSGARCSPSSSSVLLLVAAGPRPKSSCARNPTGSQPYGSDGLKRPVGTCAAVCGCYGVPARTSCVGLGHWVVLGRRWWLVITLLARGRRCGGAGRGHGCGARAEKGNNDKVMQPPALAPMPTLRPTAASTADADRAALHTTASGVPNEHVSRLRQ